MDKFKIVFAAAADIPDSDREAVADLIGKLNKILKKDGPLLQLIKAKGSFRKSDLDGAELMIAVGFRATDEAFLGYTEKALERYAETGKPAIVPILKQTAGERELGGMKRFMETLEEDRCYLTYETPETLAFAVLCAAAALETGLNPVCRGGAVTVNGRAISEEENIPCFSKNRDMATLKKEQQKTEERFSAALKLVIESGNTEEAELIYLEEAKKRNRINRETASLENGVIRLAVDAVRKKNLSEREKKAYRYFFKGEYRSALSELEIDKILDGESAEKRPEELALKLKLLSAVAENVERISEKERCFEIAESAEQRLGIVPCASEERAQYLCENGEYKRAAELYEELSVFYAGRDDSIYERMLVRAARLYERASDTANAERCAEKAEKSENPLIACEAAAICAEVYFERADYAGAIEAVENAKRELLTEKDAAATARLLISEAAARTERLETKPAGELFAKAVVLLDSLSEKEPEQYRALLTDCLNGQGRLKYLEHDADGAVRLFKQARSFAETSVYGIEGEYEDGYAGICANLGKAYLAAGMFGEAKRTLLTACSILIDLLEVSSKRYAHRLVDAVGALSDALKAKGGAYENVGICGELFSIADKHIDESTRNNIAVKADILCKKAKSHEKREEIKRARELFEQAYGLAEHLCEKKTDSFIAVFLSVGRSYAEFLVRHDENEAAATICEKTAEKLEKSLPDERYPEFRLEKAAVYCIHAEALRKKRKFDYARKLAEKAEKTAEEYCGDKALDFYETKAFIAVYEALTMINSDEAQTSAAVWYSDRAIDYQRSVAKDSFSFYEHAHLAELYLVRAEEVEEKDAEKERFFGLAIGILRGIVEYKTDYSIQLAGAYYKYGCYLAKLGRTDEAFAFFENGKTVALPLAAVGKGGAFRVLLEIYGRMAEIYHELGEYDMETEFYGKKYETATDKRFTGEYRERFGAADAINAMRKAGGVLSRLGREKQAQEKFEAGFAVADDCEKDDFKGLFEKAMLYYDMSLHEVEYDRPRSALKMRRKAKSTLWKAVRRAPKDEREKYSDVLFDLYFPVER